MWQLATSHDRVAHLRHSHLPSGDRSNLKNPRLLRSHSLLEQKKLLEACACSQDLSPAVTATHYEEEYLPAHSLSSFSTLVGSPWHVRPQMAHGRPSPPSRISGHPCASTSSDFPFCAAFPWAASHSLCRAFFAAARRYSSRVLRPASSTATSPFSCSCCSSRCLSF